MPSSTSSFERESPVLAWSRAWIVALVVAMAGVGGWELHWRAQGFSATTQNTDDLWVSARREATARPGRTVFIGSSRILFDIDLDRWASHFEDELPVQLALEGTGPRPFLSELARDPEFRGFLIVGVTPGLFFGEGGVRRSALNRLETQTPAQRSGQWISQRLERVFAFMDGDTRLFEQLDRLAWPQREGIRPALRLPRKLLEMREDRGSVMWWKVADDPEYRQLARDIWQGLSAIPRPPPEPEALEAMFRTVREDVAAIRARGGEVVFVRCPEAGPFAEAASKHQPRAEYWDRLLRETEAVGVHFADHPALADVELPEWSHVAPEDQGRFTDALAELVAPVHARWKSAAAHSGADVAP